MEIDSNLASLLQTLTMADPLTAPRSWESIPSEGGFFRPANLPTNSGDPIHQPSSVAVGFNFFLSGFYTIMMNSLRCTN
jgi:hypothetical protein